MDAKAKPAVFAAILLSVIFVFLFAACPAKAADAQYADGGFVSISNVAETNINKMSTTLPAGDNLVIAIFQYNSTATVNINPRNLRLRNTANKILSNNTYGLRVGGATDGKQTVSMMLLAADYGAPANAVYNLTAQASAANSNGEAKMAVINGVNFSYQDVDNVAISNTQTRLVSHQSGVPAGDNIVIVAVQVENSAAATRTIAAGALNLTRQGLGGTLASNGFAMSFETTGNPIKDMGILFVANDTNAPANPIYNVTATASNTASLNASVQIIVISGIRNTAYDSSTVAVAASTTMVGLTNTTWAAGKNLVLGAMEFSNTVNAVRGMNAQAITLNNFTTVQANNQMEFHVGAANGAFLYRTYGLMWLDSTAAANTKYNMTAIATNTGINSDGEMVALRLTSVMKANSTLLAPTTINTGENSTYQGNCEANFGNATSVYIILQNSTDNVSFSPISTTNTDPLYANVSNYSLGALVGNSSTLQFQVNASIPRTSYVLRVQCNSTTTEQFANTTANNLTVNQKLGFLNVTMIAPPLGVNTSVGQNRTFVLTANVTCLDANSNPTATCGQVNGSARYNFTGAAPNAQINTTSGNVPLWSTGNQTAGVLNYTNTSSMIWTVNASGKIGLTFSLDVNFTSNLSIQANDTSNTNITITPCQVDYTLQWSRIAFGQLPPSKANAAPGNAGNAYNITVNPGSCNLDFYIKGSNLTNITMGNVLGVGNITWSNVSNTYSSSVNLTDIYKLVKSNLAPVVNVTTWYWMNVPAIFAGFYNGTISISGVISGQQPP